MKNWIKNRYQQISLSIKQEKLFYLFALLSTVIAGVFVCIMHTHTLPYAEGWYTYYAQCIHKGILPYRDFEYLYPPIYIYTVSLITRIFGYDLIVLRRLGILLFAAIALVLYLSVSVITGKKRSWIALLASVSAVFYLQSEVVQSFYDYVRLMDLIAALSLLFLLRATKAMLEKRNTRKDLLCLGIFSALLLNIKQNVGLIFLAATLCMLIYAGIWCKQSRRDILKTVLYLGIPVIVIEALILLLLLISGSLGGYLSMTGFSAAGAKGGIQAILFGWIKNNIYAFIDSLFLAGLLILVILGLYIGGRLLKSSAPFEEKTLARISVTGWCGIAFAALMLIGLLVLALSRNFAFWLAPTSYLSPYAIFLVVFPLFVALGVWGIVDIARRQQTMQDVMLLFILSGAYFAIAFSCGNSGGIAEGQSSFGICFIVTAILLFGQNLLRSLPHKAFQITGYAAAGLSVVVLSTLSLQFADKKMIDTYNWWGMTEADYWSSSEKMELPLTEGLKVSEQTKAVYDSVCNAIMENTDKEDPIFCFPQIPLIYSICDRTDPGTATKVQWFDVASDASVTADMDIIKANPPKAVVIFNTAEGAYNAHENAFRGGNTSATREMREFLYNFVADGGYRFYGRFVSNGNSVSLWLADENAPAVNFAGGDGSKESPFIISSKEQFLFFADMVNGGRTFEGQYIRQTADIDLLGQAISPIGAAGQNSYFAGVYDGGGHTISHFSIANEEENLGLFGGLSGSIYNLGVLNGSVEGLCCGGLVGHSVGNNAKIVNCFVAVDVFGYRAGGIADDFSGRIENCISLGALGGEEIADAVARTVAQTLKNVFIDKESILTKKEEDVESDDRISAVSAETLNSAALADILNANVDLLNEKEDENGVKLLYWQVGPSGHLLLVPAA